MSVGRMVAGFSLPDQRGNPVSLWDYRQRQPLVLVLFPEGLSSVLDALIPNYGRYRKLKAEIVVISDQPAEVTPPFPVLQDVNGVARQLCPSGSCVLIVDRYGEISARLETAALQQADQQDVLEWIRFLESQCPECGISHWPLP